MPELPEVETVRRGLARRLPGLRVEAVRRSDATMRRDQVDPDALVGRAFVGFGRHGKFLSARLDDGSTWVIHLGMSGKLLLCDREDPPRPHTHLVLELSDGTDLRYVDPRRFGMLVLHPPGTNPTETLHYGPDALDPMLDDVVFASMLRTSRAPLKSFLLDQTKVAGLGNIYACEALWRARLGPRRPATAVGPAAASRLLSAIRSVLEDSLATGGTSFNDYVDSIGRPGSFLFEVAVFRRAGQPCPRCGTPVRRIVQAGRSTFYCPGCQR